jgi:pyrimidine-specific ribonucleoside hydrolase
MPIALIAIIVAGCSTPGPRPLPASNGVMPTGSTSSAPAATATSTPRATGVPERKAILFDTDAAADDLVALAFLVASPNVELVGITVSGTGEAHCAGGVDVVLRLLERLAAPDIPVACGRDAPLEGSHEFPREWRERVDAGSGLELPHTTRTRAASTAVELISRLAAGKDGLTVLTTGPLTNLAGALLADPTLPDRLGDVVIMGGALHVPGNLTCCGAPAGNAVAEWNVYVDPHAAKVVVDRGLQPTFVSLDSTNSVAVTTALADRAMHPPTETPAARVVADLFFANQFMRLGDYYLWDPLAALVAAGYPVGNLTPAAIDVIEDEGPASGATRPIDGEPNIRFLTNVDGATALDTLLRVLSGG